MENSLSFLLGSDGVIMDTIVCIQIQ